MPLRFLALFMALVALAQGCAAPAATREPLDPAAIREALAADREDLHGYASSQAYLHFTRGMLALQGGSFSEAQHELREALVHDPGSVTIRTELATAQWHLGRHDESASNVRIAIASDPGHAPAYLLLGRIAVAEGRREKAHAAYERAIELDPSDPLPYGELAGLLLEAGDVQEAKKVFEANARAHPGDPQPWMDLGVALEQHDLLGDAQVAYRRAREIAPSDVYAHEALGRVCEGLRRRRCAIDAYRGSYQMDPSRRSLMVRVATLYSELGETDEARGVERALLSSFSGSAQVRVEVALVAYGRGEIDLALRRLDDAVKLDPSHERAAFYRGYILENRGRLTEAVDAYRKVSVGQTYYFEARVHLGTVLSRLGRHEQALELLRATATDRRDSIRASVELIEALRRAGESDEAQRVLAKRIEEQPDEPELLDALAQLYGEAGRLPEAVESLRDAVRRHPNDARVSYVLGMVLDRAGDVEAAVMQMYVVLRLEPDHTGALNFIAYSFADRGIRLDEAASLVAHAVDIDPLNGYFLDSEGWVLFKQGKIPRALETLRRAMVLLPDHPVLLEHLGDVYTRLGRTKDARRSYRGALSSLEGSVEPPARVQLLRKLDTLGRAGPRNRPRPRPRPRRP